MLGVHIRWIKRMFALLALAVIPVGVMAEEYPSRPVKMIVPFPVGGVTDMGARIFAKALGDKLGQPIVIENRGGVGGVLGTSIVKRATPEGYTILYGTSGPMVVVESTMKSVPYDSLEDFTPLAALAEIPMVLVVNAKSPFKTLAELIKFAKANPGKLTFASAGLGTAPNLAMEMLKDGAQIDLLHVPYKGLAEATRVRHQPLQVVDLLESAT